MEKICNVMSIPKLDTNEILLKMKLLTLMLFVGFLSASANSYSQATKFTLDMKNASISDVFQKIEEQSEFVILFNEKTFDINRKVDVIVKDKTVENILDQIFNGDKNAYKIFDHQIAIYPNEINELPSSIKYEIHAEQKKGIAGKVRDQKGLSLPGATVLVKGTAKGAITDSDGNYSISDIPENAILQFSFVGMKTQEIKVGVLTTLNVTLVEEKVGLDEIVVVGYGTQKKVHVTGSVSQISAKELNTAPMVTVSQMLEGKLPGLTTVENSGQPGQNNVSMLVRGTGTYNSSGGADPLFLVDGVERAFGSIDPNDIETVSILKDAAAGAVYGVKAGQGVIMITTKRGISTLNGKPTVKYSGSLTMSQCTRLPDFLTGTEFVDWFTKAQDMDGSPHTFSPAFREKVVAGDPANGLGNTDWMDLILKKLSPTHQHNITVNGGTDNVKYFVSAGYMNQDGVVKDLTFQRGNIRSNIDVKISNRLSMEINLAGRKEDTYIPGNSDFGIQNNSNVLYQAMVANPFNTQYYNGMLVGAGAGTYNPPAYLKQNGFQKNNSMILESSAALKYKIPGIDGLKLNVFMSYDWRYDGSRKFGYGFTVDKYNLPTSTAPLGSWAPTPYFGYDAYGNYYDGDGKTSKKITRPSLDYNKVFGKHDIGALLLYEQTDDDSRSLSGTKRTFAVNDIIELNMGQTYTAAAQGTSSSRALAGYVGRLNYAYDSKYLFELVCRRDGSYKFPKNSRWGTFPSVSAGWVVSKEGFFNSLLPKIDFFKLRASAGLLGRDNVNDFLYDTYYQYLGTTPSIVLGSTPYYALGSVNSYPSRNLTWEKTKSYNVGFELYAWNHLFGLELDAFYKYTYDILQNVGGAYPPSLGGYYPSVENTGSVDVRGFEALISHQNTIGKFVYSLKGNVSYAKNRILTKIETEGLPYYQSVIGQSTGVPTGYVASGLFQSQAELNNTPYMVGSRWVGDISYKDLNGDGQINSQDRTFIGKPLTPALYFGLDGNLSYKGFDFDMNWQGAALNDVQLTGAYSSGVEDNTLATKAFYSNRNSSRYVVENSWTPENTDARFPRLSLTHATPNGSASTWWVENGAYLRLKSATLGYKLPKVSKKLGLQNIRVYISGTNLLTFSRLKYFDPETPSVTNAYYPQQRTYSCGINVTF
ncbi:MAG: TonB-dependent receptor [Bacteroidota bacterium]|nr:TonB-dependent receptor [Bacteroidota bacterium]